MHVAIHLQSAEEKALAVTQALFHHAKIAFSHDKGKINLRLFTAWLNQTDSNEFTADQFTAVEIAAGKGYLTVVQCFLDLAKEVFKQTYPVWLAKYGLLALHKAGLQNKMPIVNLLLAEANQQLPKPEQTAWLDQLKAWQSTVLPQAIQALRSTTSAAISMATAVFQAQAKPEQKEKQGKVVQSQERPQHSLPQQAGQTQQVVVQQSPLPLPFAIMRPYPQPEYYRPYAAQNPMAIPLPLYPFPPNQFPMQPMMGPAYPNRYPTQGFYYQSPPPNTGFYAPENGSNGWNVPPAPLWRR